MLSAKEIDGLIENPIECLEIELKDWLDPGEPEGKAKIVKAIIAMRNNNGGVLMIGFRDGDGSPNLEDAPGNVRQIFHKDNIQRLVIKYAFIPFEIFMHYPEIEGKIFVIIEIPAGVTSPVSTQSEIKEGKQRPSLGMHQVYMRTLAANGSPSSALIKNSDWKTIMRHCSDNSSASCANEKKSKEDLANFLGESFTRYNDVFGSRGLEDSIPDHGAMEAAVVIDGEIKKHNTDSEFLDRLMRTNPRHTGWPVWCDTREYIKGAKAYPYNGCWEAMIAEVNGDVTDGLEFWRISPKGRFYLYRALSDDIGFGCSQPQDIRVLDFEVVIRKVAECMSVGVAFAKKMQASHDAQLRMAFRWRGLDGRFLYGRANQEIDLDARRPACQDELLSEVTVPVITAPSVIHEYVYQVISELFAVFGGFGIEKEFVGYIVWKLLGKHEGSYVIN